MFGQVFNPDNFFWRLLSKGVDFVGLGLFWAALSLPVITIGPASAALYYTVVKTFRQKEDGAFGMMWKAFVSNLKKGIPVTLICIPITLLLAWGYSIMAANSGSGAGKFMYMTYYVALLIPAGLVCYLFPLMGRFEMKIGNLFSTSLFFVFRHLPSTIILVMLNVQLIIYTIEEWWPIFFTPVLTCLLSSLFLERIFPKYLTEEETAVLQNKLPDDDEWHIEENDEDHA